MTEILRPFIDLLFVALQFFHKISGNWGVAIILLTLMVRALLLPLTIKQTRAMRVMQELQPKMQAMRERYKDNREQLAQETMKFYKEQKVNPMSGCLPMLPQIPIMLALFYLLTNPALNKGVLEGSDFLWIKDLTAPYDVVLVALMFVTQLASMLMVTKDPQQRRMMLPIALILPVVTWTLPSGVVLYWVTMNLWIIVQQWIQFDRPSPLAALGIKAAGDKAEGAAEGRAAPDAESKPSRNGSSPQEGEGGAKTKRSGKRPASKRRR